MRTCPTAAVANLHHARSDSGAVPASWCGFWKTWRSRRAAERAGARGDGHGFPRAARRRIMAHGRIGGPTLPYQIKRAHVAPDASDGARVPGRPPVAARLPYREGLQLRCGYATWPPATNLRRWFGHDAARAGLPSANASRRARRQDITVAPLPGNLDGRGARCSPSTPPPMSSTTTRWCCGNTCCSVRPDRPAATPIGRATPVPPLATVAVGVLRQILLVVILGVIERARRGDLGGDVVVTALAQARGVGIARRRGGVMLLGRGGVDGRTVLRAEVVAPAHAPGGIALSQNT